MILGRPRACANGCGAVVEWAFDRDRRVGLLETTSRAPHVCARRVLGAFIACRCGAPIHTYADGTVEDARTRLPHACAPSRTARPRAEAPSGAGPASRPPGLTAPPAAEEPAPSLAEQLGL